MTKRCHSCNKSIPMYRDLCLNCTKVWHNSYRKAKNESKLKERGYVK